MALAARANRDMATGYKKPNSVAEVKASTAFAWTPSESKAVPVNVSGEAVFQDLLIRERRRAERSRSPFLLMLLDAHLENGTARNILSKAVDVLAPAIRDTDAIGWYRDGAILGAVFTELGDREMSEIREILGSKTRSRLQEHLGVETAAKIVITLHTFPETWDPNDKNWAADANLYPEFQSRVPTESVAKGLKRVIDIVASGLLITLLLPLFAVIAVVIKLTSSGPILFKQERMGRFAKRFKVLKFRSMYLNNAPTIHQEYVKEFISGTNTAKKNDSEAAPIYKIVNDPRVTPVGSFLRKTSLDELPQLWNVLVGEMSLVGPRPPLPYEYAVYQSWHRRRVLEVQPGITGLWQVYGRSRTTFDEMVRLDLYYTTNWSLWLDIKILLMTPKAVLLAAGAH